MSIHERGITPEDIQASVANISDVYRFAIGETALPSQDPLLGERYFDEIRKYFEFSKGALTNPAIVRVIRDYDVGRSTWDQGPRIVLVVPNMRIIVHDGFSHNAICLDVGENPTLNYTREDSFSAGEHNPEEEMPKWQKAIMEKYSSPNGNDSWRFDQDLTYRDSYRFYLFGIRPLQFEDLLEADTLREFVQGVGHTFAAVKRNAFVKHTGFDEEAGIIRIIEGFNEANAVLEKAFTHTKTK